MSALADAVRVWQVHPDYPSGICIYCGELADTLDHLLPATWTGTAARRRIPVVPACRECNSTLNDKHITDVAERRSYVQAAYRAKYRKYLRVILWSDDDLMAMGPSLRLAIVEQMAKHERAMRRMSWPTEPDYDAEAWACAWEEPAPLELTEYVERTERRRQARSRVEETR